MPRLRSVCFLLVASCCFFFANASRRHVSWHGLVRAHARGARGTYTPFRFLFYADSPERALVGSLRGLSGPGGFRGGFRGARGLGRGLRGGGFRGGFRGGAAFGGGGGAGRDFSNQDLYADYSGPDQGGAKPDPQAGMYNLQNRSQPAVQQGRYGNIFVFFLDDCVGLIEFKGEARTPVRVVKHEATIGPHTFQLYGTEIYLIEVISVMLTNSGSWSIFFRLCFAFRR